MATSITTKAVLTINGKQVEDTFNGLKRASAQLERELKKLPEGTQEFIDKSKELAAVNKRFGEVKDSINATKKAAQESGASVSGFFEDTGSAGKKMASDLLAGNLSFKTLGSTIKIFATESWAAIGSIPIVGWIAAAVVAIGLGVREVLQYNEELQEANKLTGSITKLQGDALDQITLKARAMKEAFGFEDQETLEAAKALVGTYKISYLEALDELEKGAIKGGKANKEYLESVREYPAFFSKAGYSVKEFIAVINAGYDVGIFNDKLPDAIKEFSLSVEEQTPTVKDALVNAFGAPFATELLQKINTGKITVKQGLEELSTESAKYNLTQKQQAQLTADLFRGAGEDAGGFLKVMEAVHVAAENLNRPLTETEQILKQQVDQFNELEKAKYDAMESDSVIALKREFDIFWKNLQIGYYNFLSWIRVADREFQASSRYMEGVFRSLPKAAVDSFTGIIDALSGMIKGFASGAIAISKFFKGDFDGAKEEAAKFAATLPTFYEKIKATNVKFVSDLNTGGTTLANKFRKDYDAATKAKAEAQRQLEKENAKNGNNFDGSDTKSKDAKKAADKAAKEAEAARKKAAAEAKKNNEERRKDLEDSIKAAAEANNSSIELETQFRINKLKLKEDSLQKELALADLERSKEMNAQRKQQDEILKNIAEFKEKIKNAKSGEAKSNFEKALADERELLQIHDQIVIISEETHQFRLKTIREKASLKSFEDSIRKDQLEIDRQKRFAQDELNNITTLDQAKAKIREKLGDQYSENELTGITSLGEAKKILEEKANQEILKGQLEFIKSQKIKLDAIIATVDPESPEGKALIEKLSAFADKITELQGQIKKPRAKGGGKKVEDWTDAEKNAMQTDILGFTAEQWQSSFDNLDTTADKLRAVGMVFQALSNIGQSFAELQRASAEKDFRRFENIQNKKKESLLNQLNSGYLTNEEYNKRIQKIEAETANKKAEMEYKQAKADKISRMFSIIGNTAVAISSALAAPFPVNLTLPWIVGALGAVQLGIAAAQPLPDKPSFARGGFTGSGFGSADQSGYKPAGIVHANEWVAPEWMTQSPRYAKVIDYLETIRTGGAKPMANGGFVEEKPTTSTPSNAQFPTSPVNSDPNLLPVLSQMRDFLESLIVDGVTMEDSFKNGKRIKKLLKNVDELENKNKH